MADLTSLVYATVTATAKAVFGDTYDPGNNPDYFLPWCDVTLSPRLTGLVDHSAPTNELRLKLTTPPLLIILAPYKARIETGVLRAVRSPAPATETPTNDELNAQNAFVGVRILAETSVLELPVNAHLVYDVKFGDMSVNGSTFRYDDFTFAAPTSDTTIDFATVARIDT